MTNKFTKILLVSSAVLGVHSMAAQAADVVVAAPEPVEYVRVCDAYGAGYFYIPGTETCMQIGGHVRVQADAGDNVYKQGEKRETYSLLSRATIDITTATETDLGLLRTFIELRSDFSNGEDDATGQLRFGYIDLGGLRIGMDESAFVTFAGYLGDILNDDVISAGIYRTNLIQYNWASDNGVSAIVSFEQGNSVDFGNTVIDDYVPHVVAGLKLQQGWGSVLGLVSYDSLIKEVTGKVRLNVNVTDSIGLWAMGAVTSADNGEQGAYNTFAGDYAVWAGASFGLSDSATGNLQLSMDEENEYVAANVAFTLTPGLVLTPELNYVSHNVVGGKDLDGFGGSIRLQRSF